MKSVDSHRRLLELLQKKERSGDKITQKEILSASGWKESTFLTYLNKGQLSDFLHELDGGYFEAFNSTNLSPQKFTQLLSQSKHRRGLGHNCKSRLSKALLKKSKDNMLLALELYNRPTLENRIDGFVLFFCVAWEQLLKAILIEKYGEEAIFRKSRNSAKIRETISLRDCLGKVYEPNDLVKKNIERIAFYRDQAVHLLMPEVQVIISRVFQSGILNYSAKFEEFTEQQFIVSNHSGILSLVGDLQQASISVLRSNYGKDIGDEVFLLISDLTKEAENTNDIRFSIPLNVRLVYARENQDGEMITVAKADEGMEGLKKAIIVEKPTERHKTHPFKETDAIKEINKRLQERYAENLLDQRLVAYDKITKKPVVNSHCFRAVAWKLKWKKSDNKYHYENKDPIYHYFSDHAIEEFISKVMTIDGYLQKARKDYSEYHKKKKASV
jgi:hypothetical protein